MLNFKQIIVGFIICGFVACTDNAKQVNTNKANIVSYLVCFTLFWVACIVCFIFLPMPLCQVKQKLTTIFLTFRRNTTIP